jgi:hypothetical protein
VCGWIYKKDLDKKGIFYKAGTKRSREDGTSFNFRQDNYEVLNKDLNPIGDIKTIVAEPKPVEVKKEVAKPIEVEKPVVDKKKVGSKKSDKKETKKDDGQIGMF